MSIYAALRYRDAAAAIDWLERAFGFQTIARHEAPDGTIAHAELRLGDERHHARHGRRGPPGPAREPPRRAHDDLRRVEDVDALHERAQAPAPT